MKYIFTITLALMSFSFISFGQTAAEITELSDRPHRCSRTIPTVIQSTGNNDKDVNLSQNGQNLGSLDITDPNTDPEFSGMTPRPNPTKGKISIRVPESSIGEEVEIYDMTGRMIGNPTPIGDTSVDLLLEGESGIYLIVVRTEKYVLTERVLLE